MDSVRLLSPPLRLDWATYPEPVERVKMAECTPRIIAEQLVIGAAITVAGSAVGLWLPPALAIMVGIVALLRICWLEDNIHHDLLTSDRVPPGYKACRARRRAALPLFRPHTLDETTCPVMLASQLRIQSHAWSSFLWSLAAAIILTGGSLFALIGGAIALGLGVRSVDRFALAQSVVLTGNRLAPQQLVARSILAPFAINASRKD